MNPKLRAALRWLLVVVMVVAGANHFVSPATYVAMMPDVLPAPLALVPIAVRSCGESEWPS